MKFRVRYSLRGFLLGAAVVAVATSWFAVEYLQRFRQETAVIRRLAALQGDIQFESRSPTWFWSWFGDDMARQASSLDFSYRPLGDAELVQITKLSGLEALYLDGTKVSDAGVAQLAGKTGLVALSMGKTAIRRPPPLQGMSKLLHLDLANTAIEKLDTTDLLSLEYLGLGGTQIRDEVLAAFGRLPKLRTLDLKHNPNITDRGVENLKRSRLPRLTRISIWGTGVTDAGAESLATEFPGSAVDRGPAASSAGDPSLGAPTDKTATKGR